MAKKKKSQLKPVARPFATASVPKKVVEDETLDSVDAVASGAGTAQAENATENATTTNTTGGADKSTATVAEPEFDPVKAEEQLLQILVDKLQEKTEKEVNRTIKAIEYDRRFTKTLSRLELDPILRNRVLRLVQEERESPDETSASFPVSLDEPEDKVLLRAGIIYGALMRLGYTEDRVFECIKALRTFEVDEAFDWLYLYCSEEELEDNKESPETREVKTPQTPRTPQSFQTGQFLSAEARFTPSSPSPSPSRSSLPSEAGGSSEDMADIKSRILQSYANAQDDDSRPPSPDSSELGDLDPNSEYARVKARVFQRTLGPSAPPDIAANAADEKRLVDLRQHYFFNEKDAERDFQTRRDRIRAAALELRLHAPANTVSNTSAPVTPVRKQRPPKITTPASIPPIKATGDALDDTSDSEQSGGFFGTMLDEMPAAETSGNGVVVSIRDMSLPKHWAGRTPKVVLTETVHKTDRYAAVSFYQVSGGSRAVRAGVSIRWGSGKAQDWAMDEDGCHDERQAEHFISTVALHALTFTPQLGFANATATGGAQTYFRVLPPVFRDLWNELEAKRKEAEDNTNRQIWAKLRDIVEPRLGTVPKTASKILKQPSPPPQAPSHVTSQRSESESAQIAAGFRARQESAAYQEMLPQRNSLPIAAYRNEIISTLESSQVMVLSGETGCGKSTQVPSFILEHELSFGRHCKVYCTEPRRISAISLAQRVSRELGDAPGSAGTNASIVGYSIRLESNTTKNTRLAFVTNGIALRMLEGGSGNNGKGTAFDEITHIIIDEVHERSIESDFLLIVLKSLLEQRRDLKVILMSATLDAEKISDFFGGCPVLHVPGRTFPVDVRFLEDSVEFARWNIKEGSQYAKRTNDKFHRNGKQNTFEWTEDSAVQDDDDDPSTEASAAVKLEKRYSQATINTVNLLDERNIPYDLILKLLEQVCFHDPQYTSYSAAVLVFMPGMNEIRKLHDLLAEHDLFGNSDLFRIYPLHSTISSENQGAVFDIPPRGVRKIVIATNIAETGITIPDITCVIDSGKHREMRFDEKRQISRLVETYIAKSNAAQRRGRAGRVQAGLCFHLFTKWRHDTLMADHPLPEMLRLSLSDLALRIKILKVKIGSSIEDVLSRALDPPSHLNVTRAVSALVEVKALTTSEEITPMGRLLSKLPTDVHLGKFLLIAALFRCLDPALTIAAALNSKSPFLTPFGFEQEADRAKNSFKVDNSDFLTIHSAFSSWRRASANPSFVRSFCRKNYLSHQNLQQIEELRQQFLGYLIDSAFITVSADFKRELSRTRYGRNKTRFITVPEQLDQNSADNTFIQAALVAGLYPKILAIDPQSGQMRTVANNQPAAFHPSSVNFQRRPKDFGVNHLCFFTIMHSKKLYAWETGPVDDLALLLLCGDADFKLNSNSIFLDRKIKFNVPAKSNVALKYLRERLSLNLSTQMRGKPLTELQQRWNDLGLLALSKVKVETNEDEEVMVAAPPQIELIY